MHYNSVFQFLLEEFIDGGLEVRSERWNVMSLLQAAQFGDIHLDLIFFAGLLELILVDVVADKRADEKTQDAVAALGDATRLGRQFLLGQLIGIVHHTGAEVERTIVTDIHTSVIGLDIEQLLWRRQANRHCRSSPPGRLSRWSHRRLR